MNLIFNASAGTGKTWQITELYASLALGTDHEHLPPGRRPVPLEKMLLMTFTENAAAELRTRVSEKMMEAGRLAEESGDDEASDRARRVLRALPAANISTIHAFCSGLLRAHALEMGLSPVFQTLEEEAREALLDEMLRREIFRCLDDDGDFREFCSGVSVLGEHEYSLIASICSLLEKASGRGTDLAEAERLLSPPERSVGLRDFERIRDELALHPLPATAAKALAALNEAVEFFPDPERIRALPKFGQAKKVKHVSDELAALKERFLTEAAYEQNIGLFRAFARCLSACARRFSEAKRQRDSVDFGDQILLARDLLRGGNFSDRFEWVLVDEVQDTSRVQCEVIEALWGRDTHLVICGDRKQSIYAWRSADPQVMPDLERQMAQRGGLKRIGLQKSFRSKDRILEAVNGLFSGLFGGEYAGAELEPVESLHARTAEQGEGPCFEFLAPDHSENTTDDEMAAVARRIRLLTEGGSDWRPVFGYSGKKRRFSAHEPFAFSDILILLKRSTHQDALEKALRAEGVPCTSGGKGRELFRRQEVRDILFFLQSLCEPFNDPAFIGFLRSPLAFVTDEDLVEFGWDGETFSHETLKKRFFESGHEAAERLTRFRRQIGEKLPSQLVREMVRETAFDAHLAGLPGGEQKLANFKKALDWLRAAERGGQTLLPDVVRRFAKYAENPPRSGAAEALVPDPLQNAVTIMTVHAAKGLSKRVCFIPDISFGASSESGFAMLSQEGRLEMNVSALDGEKIKSPGWDAARASDQAVRELELMNVFYVAMTRARDLVVFSGAGTKDPNGWLKQAEGFLDRAGPEILRKIRYSEIPAWNRDRDEIPDVSDCSGQVEFKPLNVPEGLARKAVTAGLVPGKTDAVRTEPSADRRSFGSLGHKVLEELANRNWIGEIPELVERFSGEFGPVDTARLIGQLEAARGALRLATEGADALFTEYPFVMKRDDLILDGTIDLLARMSAGVWKIFDYKFTAEPPSAVLERYTPQIAAYQEAVERLYPGSAVSALLVLIGNTVQLVPAGLIRPETCGTKQKKEGVV